MTSLVGSFDADEVPTEGNELSIPCTRLMRYTYFGTQFACYYQNGMFVSSVFVSVHCLW